MIDTSLTPSVCNNCPCVNPAYDWAGWPSSRPQASWPTLSQHSRKFWYQRLLSRRHSTLRLVDYTSRTPLQRLLPQNTRWFLHIRRMRNLNCSRRIRWSLETSSCNIMVWALRRSPKLCQTQITETANEYCALKPLITKLLKIYPSDCFLTFKNL